MPGLLSLWPVMSTKSAASGKVHIHSCKKDKSSVDRISHSKFRSMGAKVSPLAFVESDTPLDNSFDRAKQVSEPLGDIVKEKLCLSDLSSPVCSKSPTISHEPNSICLVSMVSDFMEDELVLKVVCGRTRCNCERGPNMGNVGKRVSDDNEDDDGSSVGELSSILQGLTKHVAAVEKSLLAAVVSMLDDAKADSQATCEFNADCSGGCIRREVMSRLREKGFDAAICKTQWDHSRGVPGGNYEYIDVAINTHDRLLVDIDFRGQFQIARPTTQYAAALGLIPPVYVGRADRLQQLVDLMTDATKRSLQKRSMHLPPWRRAEYMRAKWLSTYDRVTDMLLLPCRAHGNLSREGSVKESVSSIITTSEKSTPSDSAEVRTLVSSKLKEIEGTGNPESPIFLDLDLDVEVDAVIYRGKVFPVGDRIKFPKDVHMEGSVCGGIELYKLQAAERRVQKQEEQEKGTEKEGEMATAVCVKTLKAALQEKRVMNMDWHPPSVRPRTPSTSPRAAGLAAEMRKSGLSSQLKSHASMGMELRGELEVLGLVRRTFSADICC